MNYGSHGRDLLLELKRTDITTVSDKNAAINSLPAYNDVLVLAALQDVKLHGQALKEQAEASKRSAKIANDGKPAMEVRPSLFLQEAAIRRNKRCLLAYHAVRMHRIQQIHYWQSPTTEINSSEAEAKAMTKNLNPAEVEFLDNYRDIVSRYVSKTIPASTGIVDLRSHAVTPPLTVDRVVVRVVDDTPFASGSIVLESGQTVSFNPGSTHYLLYSDCEAYIRSGALQVLGTEEHEG